MNEQLALGDVQKVAQKIAPAKPLTPRQQQAFDYVRAHDGVTADEVGAHLHTSRDRRPHPIDERCDYCARDGRSVLTSVALRPLVTYRRDACGHMYIARNPADRVTTGGAQRDELPGESWEDIFT